MPTVDAAVDEWPEFLETFSREHRAWLTTVEPPISGLGEPRRVTAASYCRLKN